MSLLPTQVDGLGFDGLTTALLDFIAHAPVTDATYELHTQALTLALALLSTQVRARREERALLLLLLEQSSHLRPAYAWRGISSLPALPLLLQVSHGSVAEAASLLVELPGNRVAMAPDFLSTEGARLWCCSAGWVLFILSLHLLLPLPADPFLHAAMLAGNALSSPPSTAATAAKGSKASAAAAAAKSASLPPPAAPQQRAAVVVKALLRNVSVDGARLEDGPEPEPSDVSRGSGDLF